MVRRLSSSLELGEGQTHSAGRGRLPMYEQANKECDLRALTDENSGLGPLRVDVVLLRLGDGSQRLAHDVRDPELRWASAADCRRRGRHGGARWSWSTREGLLGATQAREPTTPAANPMPTDTTTRATTKDRLFTLRCLL